MTTSQSILRDLRIAHDVHISDLCQEMPHYHPHELYRVYTGSKEESIELVQELRALHLTMNQQKDNLLDYLLGDPEGSGDMLVESKEVYNRMARQALREIRLMNLQAIDKTIQADRLAIMRIDPSEVV